MVAEGCAHNRGGESKNQTWTNCERIWLKTPYGNINSFPSNVFFQYSLNLLGILKIFWWFHGVLKGNIKNKNGLNSHDKWTKANKYSQLIQSQNSNSGPLYII